MINISKIYPNSQDIHERCNRNMDKNKVIIMTNWSWMDSEEFNWIPYAYIDQKIMDKAFVNKDKSCNVIGNKYRIEFDVDGEAAVGYQFLNNNDMADVNDYMVACAKVSEEIAYTEF